MVRLKPHKTFTLKIELTGHEEELLKSLAYDAGDSEKAHLNKILNRLLTAWFDKQLYPSNRKRVR